MNYILKVIKFKFKYMPSWKEAKEWNRGFQDNIYILNYNEYKQIDSPIFRKCVRDNLRMHARTLVGWYIWLWLMWFYMFYKLIRYRQIWEKHVDRWNENN
jgi:hypothetical protein